MGAVRYIQREDEILGYAHCSTLHLPEYNRHSCVGKSLEIIPQGTIHLIMGNDHFEWCDICECSRALTDVTGFVQDEALILHAQLGDGD